MALVLAKEKTRYFHLSLDISTESGEVYNVDYSWACKHERYFSLHSGWGKHWKVKERLVAKKINNSLTVYFFEQSCLERVVPYVPNILIGKGNNPPVITWAHGWSNDIKSNLGLHIKAQGITIETETFLKNYEMTRDEKNKAKWLSRNIKRYFNRRVTIIPELAWSTNEVLTEKFMDLNSSVTAEEIFERKNPYSTSFGFESSKKSSSYENILGLVKRYRYIIINNKIVINTNKPTLKRFEYYYEPTDVGKPTLEFCYLDECFNLNDSYNEIYYAPRRELLMVSKTRLSLSK